jgi:hypothetical protein
MRAFRIAMVLALVAVVGGCGSGKSGAEAAARELIEAARSGDADAILARCDLKGMYETALTDYAREQLPYDRFLEVTRQNLRAKFAPSPELEYKDVAAKVNGATATVTVAIRTGPSAEWVEHTLTLTRIGGAWKMTTEGFQGLTGGPPVTE